MRMFVVTTPLLIVSNIFMTVLFAFRGGFDRRCAAMSSPAQIRRPGWWIWDGAAMPGRRSQPQ